MVRLPKYKPHEEKELGRLAVTLLTT